MFFINGISFLAVLFALMALRDVRTHSGSKHTSLKDSLLTGLRYAWHKKLILTLLILSAVTAIFGRSYQNLLPIFARDIWNGGPEGYGLLLSAAGGGAMAGAFGLASIRQMKHQGAVMLVSGLLFSFAMLAFAISPALWIGIILLFVVGVTSTIFGTIIATFIQVDTPNEVHGRLMSLYTITLIGLPSLGALGSGTIAQLLGGIVGAPRAILIGAVIMSIVMVVAIPLFWKKNIDSNNRTNSR